MKDWLKDYDRPQKFQAGGPMGGQEGAPQAAGQDQGANLDAMLAEYAQTRDPQIAVSICDMLVELVAQQQQQQGGGGAPGGAPVEGGAPPMARSGAKMNTAPVFKA